MLYLKNMSTPHRLARVLLALAGVAVLLSDTPYLVLYA